MPLMCRADRKQLERETGLLDRPLPRQNAEQNCCPRQGEWPFDEPRGKRLPSHAGARHFMGGNSIFPLAALEVREAAKKAVTVQRVRNSRTFS